MRNVLLFVLLLVCVNLVTAGPALTDYKEVGAAVQAAEGWLVLVDEGKYGEAWNNSAGYLQNAVKEKDLEKSLNAVRKPLGNALKRVIKQVNWTTTLPGAPDGEYVVIQYETQFQNKKQGVETITPMKENGEWKVSGYFIR